MDTLKNIQDEINEYIGSISKEELEAEIGNIERSCICNNYYEDNKETIKLSKEVFIKACKSKLTTFTDWTGTYIESKSQFKDVNKFIDELWKTIIESKMK